MHTTSEGMFCFGCHLRPRGKVLNQRENAMKKETLLHEFVIVCQKKGIGKAMKKYVGGKKKTYEEMSSFSRRPDVRHLSPWKHLSIGNMFLN